MNIDINKLKETPLYNNIFKFYNEDLSRCEEFLIKGGYVNDRDPLTTMFTEITQFPKIKERVKKSKSKKKAVIVSSGGFAPIHDGHIKMLDVAKEVLIEKGYDVIGGIISPDHDEYVVDLKLKDKAYMVDNRIKYILDKIRGNDFYEVDYVNGLLSTCTVNFTRIFQRVCDEFTFDPTVDVYYVFGGDNRYFANAFSLEGKCVVVSRGQGLDEDFVKHVSTLPNEEFIVFAHSDNDQSSTKVRKEGFTFNKARKLKIRVEDDELLFWESFKEIIKYEFDEIQVINSQYVTDRFHEQIDLNTETVISLDKGIDIDGVIKLDVSRYFYSGGLEVVDNYIDYSVLEKLDRDIEYTIFDDDTCFGSTERNLRRIFNEMGIKIKRFVYGSINTPDYEILDMKDFMYSKRFSGGGLVIKNNNSYDRQMYVLPYVIPLVTASISNSIEFSKRVYLLNIAIGDITLDERLELNDIYHKLIKL